MKPYTFDPKARAYKVRDGHGNMVYRKTRTAAGMTATNGRRKNGPAELSRAALSLSVKGTAGLAVWSGSYLTRGIPTRCPCCNHTYNRYALNEQGRKRLEQLRRKYKR